MSLQKKMYKNGKLLNRKDPFDDIIIVIIIITLLANKFFEQMTSGNHFLLVFVSSYK